MSDAGEHSGSEEPQHGGDTANRPAGVVDPDANPPISDPTKDDGPYGGPGNIPPQDTGAAVPPYEGRQTSASSSLEGSAHKDGANVGGAGGPVADANYKAPAPGETPGGATASPADEQPASEMPETDLDDDRVGPAHVPGSKPDEAKP